MYKNPFENLGKENNEEAVEIEQRYKVRVEDIPPEIIKNVAVRKEIVQGFLDHEKVRIFVRGIDEDNGEVSFEIRDSEKKTQRIIQAKVDLGEIEKWKMAFATSARGGKVLTNAETAIRLRVIDKKVAFITVKGTKVGMTAPEFEYRIDLGDAQKSMSFCVGEKVEKTRYVYPYMGHRFEIDVFHGENAGLVIVEVEKKSEDEEVELPEFLVGAQEVTEDHRFSNMHLAKKPYKKFRDHKHDSVKVKPSE